MKVVFLLLLLAMLLCACGGPCKTHEFGAWEIQKENTCTEAGLKTRACLNCDTVEEAEIPVAEHNFGEWVTTIESTCAENGTRIGTCANCNMVAEEAIPVLEHSFGEWETTLEASCTDDGLQTRTCSVCATTAEEAIPATGHTYGEWEDVSAPTCMEAGVQHQVCTACSNEITAEVAALGHEYDPLYCSRCKEPEYPLSKKSKFYDAKDGLSVKVNSFKVTKKEGFNMYRLNWTIKNVTENSEITHGQFRLYLSDGTWEYMYGMFPYLYYKESYTFYYDWKMLKDKDVIFVEYVPFDQRSDKPDADAPRWAAP